MEISSNEHEAVDPLRSGLSSILLLDTTRVAGLLATVGHVDVVIRLQGKGGMYTL